MASPKPSCRKRKSSGIPDIFEVDDKDLSPEREKCDDEEPQAKIPKTDQPEEVETSKNPDEHNLNEEELPKETEIVVSVPDKSSLVNVDNAMTMTIFSEESEKLDSSSNPLPKSGAGVDRTDSGIYLSDEKLSQPELTDNSQTIEEIGPVRADLEDGEVNETVPDSVDSPSIIIKFKNKALADLYKQKFYAFVKSFLEFKVQEVDDTILSVVREREVQGGDAAEDSRLGRSNSPKKKRRKRRQSSYEERDDLFVVDSTPSTLDRNNVRMVYSSKFLINDGQEDTPSRPVMGTSCFNCNEGHALRDCPYPKDYKKINANRGSFQNKKNVRYHVQDQAEQKMKPGKISAALRKALHLKKHELPSYIYRMRLLGYPPGWLEEAKVDGCELEMFDIDGNNVKPKSSGDKPNGLDPEKIITYPGFNVPPGKGFKDQFKLYNVPSYSHNYSKKTMIDCYNNIMARTAEVNLEPEDMDCDLVVAIDSADDSVQAVSLQELQEQKNSLIEEIKKSGEAVPWESPSAKEEDGATDIKSKEEGGATDIKSKDIGATDMKVEDNGATDIKSEGIDDDDVGSNNILSESIIPSKTESVNCIKTSMFGTPVLKTNSPYSKLPAADNFMKGVSPVIDFENLPNSTGKYENMSGVLQKVRNTLKNLQKGTT